MKKIKSQDVQPGMRIRVMEDDGCWMEGIAITDSHTRGYTRNKVFGITIDTMKIYSDDSPAIPVEPSNTWIGIHCKCLLIN